MARVLLIGKGGIGAALAAALAGRGDEVTVLSRSADGLDITSETSVAQALAPLEGDFDSIVVATGALELGGHGPEKAFGEVNPDAMARLLAINTIGPALLLKHGMPKLAREGRAVFAVLSARVGSIGDNRLGGWMSYRASKAALNQVIRCASIEGRRANRNSIYVALHPGTVATPLTAKYAGRHRTVSPEEGAANLMRVLDELSPENSGGFYDWKGEEIPW